ncbi:hypothetical protein [Paraglaciecola sp. L3A3]|uniref:hypothetical protein n=1 Tax=Paraglaciecola sp. L3A3 TaxID=2686358 RepID=UPI00131C20D7|nr:hypothetical protein [Paraglaciecola sp. L3A3]
MFKLFIITFEILALVMILRSSFVQFWLADLQSSVADWMLDMSLVIDKQELAELRDEIAPHTQNLSAYQKDYILQITDNKAALSNFSLYYCKHGDKNPFIYGSSLRYLCNEIDRKGIVKV